MTVPVYVRRGPRAADNFTLISNDLIRDTRVSDRARMLAVWLLSHRLDYQVDVPAMCDAMGCGRDRVRASLRELEDHGYLVRVSQRERGELVGIEYRITDTPQVTAIDVFSGDGADLDKPESQALKVRPGKHVAPNKKTKFQEDQSEEDQKDFSSPDGDGVLFAVEAIPDPKGKPSQDALAREFEDRFWPEYPRKVGKLAARTAYVRARRGGALPGDMLDAVKAYALACKDKETRFIAHAATWLNAGRWMDEKEPVTSGPRPTNGHRPYQNDDYWSTP